MAKNGNKTYILSISAIRLATKILQMPSIAKFIFLDYRKPPMYKKSTFKPFFRIFPA